MADLEKRIDQYAELAVRVGVNLQPGQTLFVGAGGYGVPMECAPFVRRVVEKAYDAGAAYVHVFWQDESLTRLTMERAAEDALRRYPQPMAQWLDEASAANAAFLGIGAQDPLLFQGVDPKRIADANKARMTALAPYMHRLGAMQASWTIVSAPTERWASRVLPGVPEGERVARLWDYILSAARVMGDDPVQGWRDHLARLAERTAWLNGLRLRRLRYRVPGTDLSLGLPEGHLWLSCAGSRNAQGVPFVPNLPTEEVFSAPARTHVEGTVRSTLPLNYGGSLIEGLWLRLENGRIVDYGADTGQEALKGLIDTDEGSHYLGEVALVPADSPIAQLGFLFYNTLFDENASCHLAIGRALPVCLEGGAGMSSEELLRRDVNDSVAHVDFMVGSPGLEIDGETDAGVVPIFRNGVWAR